MWEQIEEAKADEREIMFKKPNLIFQGVTESPAEYIARVEDDLQEVHEILSVCDKSLEGHLETVHGHTHTHTHTHTRLQQSQGLNRQPSPSAQLVCFSQHAHTHTHPKRTNSNKHQTQTLFRAFKSLVLI